MRALASAAKLAQDHLDGLGLRPVVVAHDIWLAAGLQRALPSTALACISACDAVRVLRARGTDVFCLSEQIGPEVTAGMSSLDLLQHPETAAFFRRLGPTAVLSFKPSERIGTAITALGGRLLSAPSSAARAYENKLAFIGAAERAGVPRPRWEARTLPLDFASLAADLGSPLVIQGPRGNAGQRTWLVHDQEQLEAISGRERTGNVRVAEYVEGMPFTASGVSFSSPGTGLDGRRLAAVVEPCRQVTGVDWLTPERLGSCGNAWGEPSLEAHRPEITRCVRALGADLAANNYHGVFGVDFVLAEDGPLVIEVNPRMVASLPLATELEVEAGRAPLELLHLLELLDADLDLLDVDEGETPMGVATQLIVHRLPGDADERPQSGIYRLQSGRISRVGDGAGLEDLRRDDDLLLLTRKRGEPVTDRKEFARAYARSALGENAPGLRQLVSEMRAGTLSAQ
ncbi:MAG: ATP-grasp domain-containing protein [Candidatus Dormibacteria bacterium]